jgi:cytidylate kinase
MALKKRGLAREVVGIGRNAERLQRAVDLHAIDRFSTDIRSGVEDADLVYISTPVGLEVDFIRRIAPLVKPGCIVTDAGSTKQEIVREVEETLSDSSFFVGGHPMAGSEQTGVEAATPDLFVDATYVFTPTERTNPAALALIRGLAEEIGSKVVVMDPDAHDRCAAVISHLPHIIAAALVDLAQSQSREDPQVFDMIAGSFRDMTRVAASSPDLWRDICKTNADEIKRAAETFKSLLDGGLTALESGDFEAWFANAGEIRRRFPNDRKAEKLTRMIVKDRICIAIDGPAGAGKTTVARETARRLGFKYIDTGSMYRAVAWKVLQCGVSISDEAAIVDIAGKIQIGFSNGDNSRTLVDGVDVSKEIRTPEVTRLSSPVSAISGVRRHLVEHQRRLAAEGGSVMEGRDIGSVVLPDAELKIFLTASIDERARRRWAEMQAAGMNPDLDALKRDIEERDHRDSTRSDSPLVKASGAVEVDTDHLTVDQVISRIVELANIGR